MGYKEKYEYWLNSDAIDEKDREELKSIAGNEKEIEDRFFKDLSFGTGGIRGVRGIGTNRMAKFCKNNHYPTLYGIHDDLYSLIMNSFKR